MMLITDKTIQEDLIDSFFEVFIALLNINVALVILFIATPITLDIFNWVFSGEINFKNLIFLNEFAVMLLDKGFYEIFFRLNFVVLFLISLLNFFLKKINNRL